MSGMGLGSVYHRKTTICNAKECYWQLLRPYFSHQPLKKAIIRIQEMERGGHFVADVWKRCLVDEEIDCRVSTASPQNDDLAAH